MKELAKKIARMALGEYSAYYIYASPYRCENSSKSVLGANRIIRPVDQSAVESSSESLIRDQICYLGAEAHAYACYVDGRIAGLCIYWFGERYRKRNFWPLRNREAKLVQVVTVASLRGAGIATELIAFSCLDMLEKGFNRMYARIWHSNGSSLRAFQRAGWTRSALVLELNPFRLRQPVRIRLDTKS